MFFNKNLLMGLLVFVLPLSLWAQDENCSSIQRFNLWNTTVGDSPKPSNDLDINEIQARYQVRIVGQGRNYGGCRSYDIIDVATGKSLGELPISFRDTDFDSYSPQELAQLNQRLGHMLQTDRSQLIALTEGRASFLLDSQRIRDSFGLETPTFYDMYERSGNGVKLSFSGLECQETGSGRDSELISNSEIVVGHLEFRPDITNYSSIYQGGQVPRALRENARVQAAIQNRLQTNSDRINSHYRTMFANGTSHQLSRFCSRTEEELMALHLNNMNFNSFIEGRVPSAVERALASGEGEDI